MTIFKNTFSVTLHGFTLNATGVPLATNLLKIVSLKAVSDTMNYYRDEVVTYIQQCVSYMRVITTQEKVAEES